MMLDMTVTGDLAPAIREQSAEGASNKKDGIDIEAVKALLQEVRARREKWGSPGPPINDVFAGHRVVAIYNRLVTFPPEATYHDFLNVYIKEVFGEEWWLIEGTKPETERHQLVTWYMAASEYRMRNSTGGGKVLQAPMSGASAHCLRLAFNLHQIKHLGLLQESLVKRLKIPMQFQGASYETDVTAAFVRGGFEIALEPEGKGPQQLCEFVATHLATKKTYSVEAKSRHLPGVLGRPADAAPSGKQEPNVSGLIRKALQKTAAHDRIICIDVNYPQRVGPEVALTWGPVVRQQVEELEAAGHGPALLMFTNYPFHYLQPGEAADGHSFMMKGLREPRFQPNDLASVVANFPGAIDALRGFQKPVPGEWE